MNTAVVDEQARKQFESALVKRKPEPIERFLPAADHSGYLATLVGGVVTRRNDAETGARPGRLIRSSAAVH